MDLEPRNGEPSPARRADERPEKQREATGLSLAQQDPKTHLKKD